MFINADDMGFIGNTNSIISTLQKNDDEFLNQVNLSLIENDYQSALYELVGMGYIYEFRDNHENKVHLIRHWFIHNRYRKDLMTNYGSFLKQVELVDGKYVLKESSKENTIKIKQSKLKQIKIKQDKVNKENNINEEDLFIEEKNYTMNDFLRDKGVSSINELTPEDIEEWKNICINGL
jgi:hypothetical protein